MKLDDLLQKTCLLGLSYFDKDNQLLRQQQLAGTVVHVDDENGISIELVSVQSNDQNNESIIAKESDAKVFVIPPTLTTWFKAPPGLYRDANGNKLIENPDYFVTWDIYKTQSEKQGDHEWWEWVPRTTPPAVN